MRILCFILIAFAGFCANAAESRNRSCAHVISLAGNHSSAIRTRIPREVVPALFPHRGEKFLIGILAELESGQTVLAVGPYLTGTHRTLARIVETESKSQVKKYLWSGELVVSDQRVSAVNDTSGFLHTLAKTSPERVSNDPHVFLDWLTQHYPQALPDRGRRHVDVREVASSEGRVHLDPDLLGMNYRHEIGNKAAVVASHLETLANQHQDDPVHYGQAYVDDKMASLIPECMALELFLKKLERDGVLNVTEEISSLRRVLDRAVWSKSKESSPVPRPLTAEEMEKLSGRIIDLFARLPGGGPNYRAHVTIVPRLLP